MEWILVLVFIAVLIYAINVVPVLMPPTWTILAFIYIHYHPPFLPAIFLGALAATLGRVTLYFLSKKYFRKFFSQKSLQNYDALGNFIKEKEKISIPLIVTYAFFPVSSNYVYIAAGLTEINIRVFASSFFIGRLISYSFWVAATHAATSKLEEIFTSHMSNLSVVLIEFGGIIFILLLGRIQWSKILKRKIN